MNAQKKFVAFIALVLVVGIGGIIVFAMNQQDTDTMSSTMSHSSDSSSMAHHDAVDVKDTVKASKVEIKNFAYGPENINVKVGTTVTWTNEDTIQHDITGHDGKGPKSELLSKGETYSYTFSEAGTFNYHCSPHPYMVGTVIVTE